ncbi:MAG: hypothetical protein KAH44_30895, partial [Oricola sp.]|nr:hypothetical protein [Oricola sp.]
ADIKTFLELYGREGEGRVRQLEFVINKTAREIEALESKRAQIDETLKELDEAVKRANGRLKLLSKALNPSA